MWLLGGFAYKLTWGFAYMDCHISEINYCINTLMCEFICNLERNLVICFVTKLCQIAFRKHQ
ncbi:hypothetical protein Hdeb2414_s0009g00320091 [Helianthus debilis subsp. tardiflorus]